MLALFNIEFFYLKKLSLMMPTYYKLVAACLIFLLQACGSKDVYNQKAKTLDSLSGAVNTTIAEFERLDTITLQKALLRFSYYQQFIQQNLQDTIAKSEADNLLHFYKSGKSLENFALNKKSILERANLVNSQLIKLANDVKNGSIELGELTKATAIERDQASKLIQASYNQQKKVHTSLEEFKNSLSGVEQLIRSHNNGELPVIIKDTITL